MGARVVMVDRDEAALNRLARQARRRRDPAGHRPARTEGLRRRWCRSSRKAGQLDILHANAGLYVGGDLSTPIRGHRPDAQSERQRRDEERARRAAAHDRAPHRRHHRDEFGSRRIFHAMGAGLCVVQMGDQLLCPDGAAASVQARHSRGLDLAGPRHHRAARGLAAGEAKGSRGIRQPARGQRSRQCGDVHADAAARHDNSRLVMLPTNFDPRRRYRNPA